MVVTSLSIATGAALTVVAVLLTMIWTIREMYIHEARFADTQLFASAAAAATAKSDDESQAHLLVAKHSFRISHEYMFVAEKHSNAGVLLLTTELFLAGMLASLAAASIYDQWPFLTSALACLAIISFFFSTLAVYRAYGNLRFAPFVFAVRQSARALSPLFPFLGPPHPTHWPQIDLLVEQMEPLRNFRDSDPYRVVPLAEQIVTLWTLRQTRRRQPPSPPP